MVVKRPKLSLAEEFYLPAIVTGLAITLKHLRKLVSGKTKATMSIPKSAGTELPPQYSLPDGVTS
jgi:NADH-quinone oxidoreductase subunit I